MKKPFDENRLFNKDEVAALLRCSESKVRTLWQRGKLMFVQQVDGHRTRYSSVAHINDYLSRAFPGVCVRIVDGQMVIKK